MKSMLKINNLNLTYTGQQKPVLNNISLNINNGEFVVILGGNGSGKSSLLKAINKTYSIKTGIIEIAGTHLCAWNHFEFAKSVVTLEQDTRKSLFYDLTVLENCLIWSSRLAMPKFRLQQKKEKQYYSQYLFQFHPTLKDRLNTKVELLSGGEKQALLLALCIEIPPQLLLLDEHTSALDPHQSEAMIEQTVQMTKKYNITTMMTTHNLDHALKLGDRLIAIKEGKIVFDINHELKQELTKADLLTFCY